MKEDNKKKIASKIFWKLFIALLIGYTALYISEATGYYEFENYNKKKLTEERIKQFENDVKNGKNIDLNNYIIKDENNYESKISKIGNQISNNMQKNVVKGLNITFKFLNKMLG